MKIPVYAVTGFLDSGKTTLIKTLLQNRFSRDSKILLVQFESGDTDFGSVGNCSVLFFGKKALQNEPEQIEADIADYLSANPTDELWIEWNGVTPFSELHGLLLSPALRSICRIEKVIHMADAETLEGLIGRTGSALPEQIAESDFAVARGIESRKELLRLRRLLRSLNPGVELYGTRQMSDIYGAIYKEKRHPVNTLCLWLLTLVILLFTVSHIFDLSKTPVNTLINVFLGIILQAVPFLLIGVLISSAIQIFVSSGAIERRFPKNLGLGMLTAILMGFCLPVCDCASVPIFRSLVKKGVPVPVAVTFLTSTPVINPVVMLSTYYAFNGSLKIVAVRVGLGIVSSLLIGLYFAGWPAKGQILSNGFDGLMCSCGCYTGDASATGAKGRLGLYIRHSKAEFFNVGKYLLIGAFISAIFQTFGTKALFLQTESGYALSILLMMILAFLLSLCSSSDAVIARSFSSFLPTGAIMGFLVFGPMIDIKNLIMLSGGFSRKFVVKLFIAAFVLCYLVIFTFSATLLGA
jgi:uncharacterized protein